jgi:hypothetical protein
MNSEKTSKKKTKTYKERENEAMHGKRRFRLRQQLEKEGKELVKEFKNVP